MYISSVFLYLGYLLLTSEATASMFTSSIHAMFYDAANSTVTKEECYFIGLKEASNENIEELKSYLTAHDKVDLRTFYESFNIFHICATYLDIKNLLTVPYVKYVEREQKVFLSTVQQNPVNWGLDHTDGKMDNSYSYSRSGKGVTIYLLDTGVNVNHAEFIDPTTQTSRATLDQSYLGNIAPDSGHGSHTAGIAGGLNIGPAKDAKLVVIQVFNGEDGDSSVMIKALNDIQTKYKANPAPTVVSMSLAGGTYQAMNDAVNSLVSAGVPVVVAAGNESKDASLDSPASASGAITVAASDQNDQLASFSNYGASVFIVAPGVEIQSVDYQSNTGYVSMSGTSMATPLVAGVVALMLEENPKATPDQIKALLKSSGASGSFPNGTPGLILKSPYTNSAGSTSNDTTSTPTPGNPTQPVDPPAQLVNPRTQPVNPPAQLADPPNQAPVNPPVQPPTNPTPVQPTINRIPDKHLRTRSRQDTSTSVFNSKVQE